MSAKNLTVRSFKRVLTRAGLRDIRFHDLRHMFATLMLQNGEHPKVVQEMLGHATIAITMDTYSHVLPNMQREAVARGGGAARGAADVVSTSASTKALGYTGVVNGVNRGKSHLCPELHSEFSLQKGCFLRRARQDSNLRPAD
jgi:Phage integrase family